MEASHLAANVRNRRLHRRQCGPRLVQGEERGSVALSIRVHLDGGSIRVIVGQGAVLASYTPQSTLLAVQGSSLHMSSPTHPFTPVQRTSLPGRRRRPSGG